MSGMRPRFDSRIFVLLRGFSTELFGDKIMNNTKQLETSLCRSRWVRFANAILNQIYGSNFSIKGGESDEISRRF